MRNKQDMFAYSKPRHLRYMFFVDSEFGIVPLLELMSVNQRYWGGRYNPIIPVYNNVVPDSYLEFIKRIDPDYVYYTDGTNLSTVERLLNPKKYEQLNEHRVNDMQGLDCIYLLEQNSYEGLVCETGYLYKSALKDDLPFYELNFGFHIPQLHEHELLHRYKKILINDDNLDDLNRILAVGNPIYKSHLSRRNINTKILRTPANIDKGLELIIAEEEAQFKDLIYYWNRQLYFEEDYFSLRQAYITVQQLERLSKDKNFHTLLASLTGERYIKVQSETLNAQKLKELIDAYLLNGMQKVNYLIRDKGAFPYEIDGTRFNRHWNEQVQDKQILIENHGLLRLPKPSFASTKKLNGEKWAVDVVVEDSNDQESMRNKVKLPFGTFIHSHFCTHDGRITKNNDITLYAENKTPIIEFKVPDQTEIIHSLLMGRMENDKFKKSPIEVARLSDAGMRLSALVSLFDQDWYRIEEYLFDKFWLQLFKAESDYAGGNRKQELRSNIPKGKGVFTYKDLIQEHRYIYQHYNVEITDIFREDDYEQGIDLKLQYLIDKRAVFIGSKVKCYHCGANKWYSYADLNSKVDCKGCGTMITPQMETPLYYKFSEVITGNILSDTTRNIKDFDGNYMVLRALMWLKRDWQNCRQSFLFCPPMDYRTNRGRISDIDILAIQDGRFVLGEAKNKASEFNKKEIEALAWLGNNIKPNKLILAYNEGRLHQQKINSLKSLITVECEIEEYKAEDPSYDFRGILGQQNAVDDKD